MARRVGVSRGTSRNFLQTALQRAWIAPQRGHERQLLPGRHAEAMRRMGREFLWMHALTVAAWRVSVGDAPAAAPR